MVSRLGKPRPCDRVAPTPVATQLNVSLSGFPAQLHKYEDLEFGHCPNVACQNFPVLPVGLSNDLRVETVKLFCPRCEQVYRAAVHDAPSTLDGAFFGTTFPHLLLLLRPGLAPP